MSLKWSETWANYLLQFSKKSFLENIFCASFVAIIIMTRKFNEFFFFSIGFVIQSALVYYCFFVYLNRDSIIQNHINQNRVYDFEAKFEATQIVYDDTLSNRLYNEVKILCMVMTYPANHKSKAIHIKNTWGRRCNKLLFMSSEIDDQLDVVVLPIEDTREALWNKTRAGFKHLYEHYIDQYDWFLKGDDDTWVTIDTVK